MAVPFPLLSVRPNWESVVLGAGARFSVFGRALVVRAGGDC